MVSLIFSGGRSNNLLSGEVKVLTYGKHTPLQGLHSEWYLGKKLCRYCSPVVFNLGVGPPKRVAR